MASTILLIDEHPVFRQGLRLLLEKEKDLKVVAEAGDGRSALEMVQRHSPDLVVMNITMPTLDGIDATRRILSASPGTKVVALSVHSGKRSVSEILRAGAVGYVLKESVPEEMIQGIRTVLADEVFLSASISGVVVSEDRKRLSDAEHPTKTLSEPILRTKLHRPPVSADIIPRLRLIEQLEEGRQRAMTLISAPAGYGKSVLASQWLQVCGCPGAWVSLDEGDDDLRVFLTYLLAAIQELFPETPFQSQPLLRAAELPPAKILARYLLNDLDEVTEPFILVLDDYHHISNAAVRDLLVELLRHPSPMLHLALLSRRDPALPIGSLRAHGLLTEVSVEQLRFTPAETTTFLERVLRVPIDEETAAVLDARMEGWVTGLRLAAASLGHKEDVKRVLRGLKESPRYVTDYLIREVLSAVPPATARYLMATAILDRFCAPLCDALSLSTEELKEGEDPLNGEAFIEWLEETHLFVIPLDEQHHWFRYHHLFQELLKKQLEQHTGAQEVATVHSRASEWFESHGLITESIKHALAGGDFERAADTVEVYRYDELAADRWHAVERWLSMLPIDIRQARPKLLLTEAWIMNMQHQLARALTLVDQAESLLSGLTADPIVTGELAFLRGYVVYYEGQAERSRQLLEEAVSQLAGKKTPFLGEAELMLGLARCMVGQKDLAVQALDVRIGEVDSSETYLLSRLIAGLVFIYLVCGDLYKARVEAQRLQLITEKHNMRLAEAWSYYLIACTYLHTGELEAASLSFAKAVELRYVLEPRAAVDALAGLALTQQLMRLDEKAAETCQGLQEFALELNERNYLSVAQSCRARLSVLQGALRSAVPWGRSVDESPVMAELFSWLEAPSITQARVLIAAGTEENLTDATAHLQTLRKLSEECRLTCQTIEVSVLHSVALEKQGLSDEALTVLKEVVALAGPLGWVRPFVEAGPLMADLLKRLQKQNVAVDYIERLLTAFPDGEPENRAEVSSHDLESSNHPLPPTPSHPTPLPLIESLTDRELEILQLLSQRWRNKEIAEKLFIATETVKSHLNNIYQKLDVGNRRQAVEKARDLGIL
jgi:LuxR family maltose regulon positive regulatory protein